MNPPVQQLEAALACHRAGQWEEARELYQRTLAESPRNADALHLLGVLEYQSGHIERAIELLQQAVQIQPDAAVYHGNLANALRAGGRRDAAMAAYRRALALQPDFLDAHINLGNLFQRDRQWDEAERHYRRALEIDPDSAAAHGNLGLVLRDRGNLPEALAEFTTALRLRPDNLDALVNLANTLQRSGQFEQAAVAWQRAIARDPTHAEAQRQFGNVLLDLQRHAEAARALETSLAIKPDDAATHNQLGRVYAELGELDRAAAEYARAIRLAPDLSSAHYNLGVVMLEQRREEEAEACFQEALRHDPQFRPAWKARALLAETRGEWNEARDLIRRWHAQRPDDPEAIHLRAGYGEGPMPSRAPDEYVRSQFDEFARKFDRQLAVLEYRGPELLAALVEREFPLAEATLRVLDGGCGTGLCGSLLRPWAACLTGVDLSSGMLKQARERGTYDDLVEEELTGYLRRRTGAFDLIVAADTLIYFGDLAPVLGAARGALVPGGRLIFSLEAGDAPDGGEDVQLDRSGRYRHRESYVRQTLGQSGLRLKVLERDTLRLESKQPVVGLLVVAERIGT